MAITNNLENGKMKNYLIWPRNTTLLCPIIICIFILRNWINFNLAWNLFELPKNAELFHGYFIKNFAKIFLNTPGLFRLKCFFFNPYTPIPKVFWCIQRVEKGDIGMKRVKGWTIHCVKSFRILNFCGPYFPAFGLNRERYAFSPNAGKYGPEKFRIQTLHAVIRSEFFIKTWTA